MTSEPDLPIRIPPLPQPGEGTDAAAGPADKSRIEDRGSRIEGKTFSILDPRSSILDLSPCLLVCVLAFLLASTPARNSDLWLHLASGRLLAQGQFPGGTDPFASTTAGVFWVNHSWLSDAFLYEGYELGGGRALVVAKAVLIAGLAGFCYCFRRPGTRPGLVALAVAGMVLALGPWLQLQPGLLSLFGVALTLYLLERPALLDDPRARQRARALRWLLVPLFALWANLDGWFLLGPVLVGLYALGEVLRQCGMRNAECGVNDNSAFRIPHSAFLLTLAGLAACLLTPFHYHTFAWPPQLGLSHAEQALRGDPLGQSLVFSSFTRFVFASPGGWAYYLLLAAGVVSFALCGRALHPGRLLAWLALAALSVYQARAIPFFAVAAGPVLILNFQSRIENRGSTIENRGSKERPSRSSILDPLSSTCLLVLLLVLAWPGWLQPAPYQPRGWAVEPDGSLVRLARQLERWHAEQKLRPNRFALTFSPETAHYLAWFCPAEKGFLDSRLPLFDGVAEDYVRMRQRLLQTNAPSPDRDLAALLDAHQIDRIILYDHDRWRMTQAYRCLLLGGAEWDLLALEGTAALFGRRAQAGSPSPWGAGDWRREAYRPDPEHRAPLTVPPPAAPTGLFAPFYRTRDDRSPDRGEADLYLLAFDLLGERQRTDLGRQWLLALATGLIGEGSGREPLGTASMLGVRLHLTPLLSSSPPAAATPPAGQQVAEQFAAGFLALHDAGPPEALLLAVRAARRALAVNPDDAGALLLLGKAYLRLARQTREQSWRSPLPWLATIRQVQVLAALEQAVLLRPDLDEAHALLAPLYYEMGQMDRVLDHLRERLRLAEQGAGDRGPKGGAEAERRLGLQSDVARMEALVHRSQQTYQANTEGQQEPSKVLARARLAARHGLSRQALEMLLESSPAIFGKDGTKMQMELMLLAGRAAEVRAWLRESHPALFGPGGFVTYHWLLAQASAGCGGYEEADAEVDQLSEAVRSVQVPPVKLLAVRAAVALRAAEAATTRPIPGTGPGGLAGAIYLQYEALRHLGNPAGLLRQEADYNVLRGLLALEAGAVEDAQRHCRAALELWGSDAQARTGAGLDFNSRPIAQYLLQLLEKGEP